MCPMHGTVSGQKADEVVPAQLGLAQPSWSWTYWPTGLKVIPARLGARPPPAELKDESRKGLEFKSAVMPTAD